MASARSVSPGAALLRTSRMFSLPQALPQPHREGSFRQSETATEPYPTRQIISTTSLSRRTGDWGLKRPLPLRTTTKTTIPMIKVNQVDSIESVTDFHPATDHGMSLRKFQEMNIPITVPSNKGGMNMPKKSVFEDDFDFTALGQKSGEQATDDMDMRWKFKGPWLAGLTDGEMQKYLETHVRSRRSEFRKFLKGKLAKEINESAAREAKDKGEEAPAAQEVDASKITDVELTNFLRRLRDDRPRLYKLVSQFLDLAPIGPPAHSADMWKKDYTQAPLTLKVGNPYAKEGPPITHPSAGLSYLRTASYLENNPLYGPQAKRAPVEARVVAPRHGNGARGAKLGVGGFVTNVPGGDSTFNMSRVSADIRHERTPGLERLDPSIKGGAKVWVEPLFATVNSKGQTIVTVGETDNKSPDIAKELAGGEALQIEEKPVQRSTHNWPVRSRGRELGASVIGSSRTYGLKPEDLAFEK
ncbi:mitochondrial ribosomal protein MRP51 [Coniochaeta sp. 2T2.1]|nr:mitochondrial ribosomal protein MRP51 [Coniochaeta sp. 2T2.1]